MFNIFDQPWTLVAAAVLVFLGVMTFRRILPEKRHWGQWFLPAFLAGAAFGFDLLVKTDLEKINAVINTGIKAVEEENSDAIEAIISDNYHDSYHNTKKDLMERCRRRLSEPLVAKNKKRPPIIEISPPNATVVVTVIVHFEKQSYVYTEFNKPFMITKVKLDLQKGQDKRWLINQAEVLELDRHPAKWRDLR